MNWKVVVLPEFYADLEEAGDWYEQKLEGLGTRFAGEVLEVWADLAVNPLISAKKIPAGISDGAIRKNSPTRSSTRSKRRQGLWWSSL